MYAWYTLIVYTCITDSIVFLYSSATGIINKKDGTFYIQNTWYEFWSLIRIYVYIWTSMNVFVPVKLEACVGTRIWMNEKVKRERSSLMRCYYWFESSKDKNACLGQMPSCWRAKMQPTGNTLGISGLVLQLMWTTDCVPLQYIERNCECMNEESQTELNVPLLVW